MAPMQSLALPAKLMLPAGFALLIALVAAQRAMKKGDSQACPHTTLCFRCALSAAGLPLCDCRCMRTCTRMLTSFIHDRFHTYSNLYLRVMNLACVHKECVCGCRSQVTWRRAGVKA
eukprot:4736748-Pleurochrysis_carterae.AAC.1